MVSKLPNVSPFHSFTSLENIGHKKGKFSVLFSLQEAFPNVFLFQSQRPLFVEDTSDVEIEDTSIPATQGITSTLFCICSSLVLSLYVEI